jgi:hypothetical protein
MSADYEVPLATITDDRGEVFRLVRHYTDGIVMGDPVKLVVYDQAGGLVAETPFGRDVLTYRNGDGELYVFQTGFTEYFFRQAWVFRNRELLPAEGPRCYGYSLLATLRTRWLGYCFSAGLLGAGGLAFLAKAGGVGVWDVSFGPLEYCALLWLVGVLLYGRLSLTLLLALSLVASLPFARNQKDAVLLSCLFGVSGLLVRLYFLLILAVAWFHFRTQRNQDRVGDRLPAQASPSAPSLRRPDGWEGRPTRAH